MKIKIKQIIKDHFEGFWEKNQKKYPKEMRNDIYKEVKKMQGCGNEKDGFRAYICKLCGEIKKIGLTCKSKLCNKCGRKRLEEWSRKQARNLLKVPHRHCVFTIPEEFRGYFFWNRNGLKDLQDMVNETLSEYANGVNKLNREEYMKKKRRKQGGLLWQIGILTVIHTFGRDMGFNPHIHVLLAEVKIKGNEAREMNYINYRYLRKIWQYKLINYMVDKKPKKKEKYLKMFKEYSEGFYINARTRIRGVKGAIKYIGRYLARPAIAEYRITNYDGTKVKFWYNDHKTEEIVEKELTVEEFIGKLLMHVAPKNFKMAVSYGFYSGRVKLRVRKVFGVIQYIKSGLKAKYSMLKKNWENIKEKISYQEFMINSFGDDPQRCRCGGEMELYQIWHRKYGEIYNLLK